MTGWSIKTKGGFFFFFCSKYKVAIKHGDIILLYFKMKWIIFCYIISKKKTKTTKFICIPTKEVLTTMPSALVKTPWNPFVSQVYIPLGNWLAQAHSFWFHPTSRSARNIWFLPLSPFYSLTFCIHETGMIPTSLYRKKKSCSCSV